MSTRSTTHFTDGRKSPIAIIYRHSDGYPEGAGVDIHRFLDECAKLNDPRFGDPSYLAAKYVVFLADMFNNVYNTEKYERPESRLQFISVGVLSKDPGDVAFRYVVDCSTGQRPTVKCFEVQWQEDGTKQLGPEVTIPIPVAA